MNIEIDWLQKGRMLLIMLLVQFTDDWLVLMCQRQQLPPDNVCVVVELHKTTFFDIVWVLEADDIHYCQFNTIMNCHIGGPVWASSDNRSLSWTSGRSLQWQSLLSFHSSSVLRFIQPSLCLPVVAVETRHCDRVCQGCSAFHNCCHGGVQCALCHLTAYFTIWLTCNSFCAVWICAFLSTFW